MTSGLPGVKLDGSASGLSKYSSAKSSGCEANEGANWCRSGATAASTVASSRRDDRHRGDERRPRRLPGLGTVAEAGSRRTRDASKSNTPLDGGRDRPAGRRRGRSPAACAVAVGAGPSRSGHGRRPDRPGGGVCRRRADRTSAENHRDREVERRAFATWRSCPLPEFEVNAHRKARPVFRPAPIGARQQVEGVASAPTAHLLRTIEIGRSNDAPCHLASCPFRVRGQCARSRLASADPMSAGAASWVTEDRCREADRPGNLVFTFLSLVAACRAQFRAGSHRRREEERDGGETATRSGRPQPPSLLRGPPCSARQPD